MTKYPSSGVRKRLEDDVLELVLAMLTLIRSSSASFRSPVAEVAWYYPM